MPKRLTAKSTLGTLKTQAKRRLKALRAADPSASLRAAQHALARDYGFDGWTALKAALADIALGRLSHDAGAEAFLRHCAWEGDIAGGLRLLARHPDIARHDLVTAVVCGDVAETDRRLADDPQAARRKAGPLGWEPLLYLAYGRADGTNAVAIAGRLLDLGADANASFDDGWDNAFTALCGAIGLGERGRPPHPQAEALADLLLARGAAAFDTQALYNASVDGDDVRWLETLWRACEARGELERWRTPAAGLGAKMDVCALDYLLGNAVSYAHPQRIGWLVAHGAAPDGIHSYTGLKLHTLAVARGDMATATLLERLGARPEALEGPLAFLAAVMRLDRGEARRLAEREPGLIEASGALALAAGRGRTDVAAMLLELGADPGRADGEGNTPLHAAAASGAVEAARLLVAAGAPIDPRNSNYDSTPLGAAVFFGRTGTVDYLAPLSRDAAALAAAGRTGRLREVLEAEPELVGRRRRNGRTPLFELPGDEDLAVEVAQALLDHRADPAAKDQEGVTAAAAARARGLEEAAELIEAAARR